MGLPQVLICEAHRETHEWLARQLGARGLQPVSAWTGKDACELAETGAPELILLGMLLPDSDGLAVLRKLRAAEQTADIPVILLSSAASVQLLESRLGGLMVAGVLRKPIRENELGEVLDRILGNPAVTMDPDHCVLTVDEGCLPRALFERAVRMRECQALYTTSLGKARTLLGTMRPRALVLALQSGLGRALPLLGEAAALGHGEIPVVVLAENIEPENVPVLRRYGVNELLLTPVAAPRLWAALLRALGGSESDASAALERSVLLVEDTQLAAKMLSALLEQSGYHVVQAHSAEAALDVVHQSQPELMLLDILLPGMDGVAFVHQLHHEELHLPFAVVTGAGVPERVNELKGFGMIRVFEKPVRGDELLSFVDGFFAQRQKTPPLG